MHDLPQLSRTALEFITFVAEHESISRSDKAKCLEARDQECVNLGIAQERYRLQRFVCTLVNEFSLIRSALTTEPSHIKDMALQALVTIDAVLTRELNLKGPPLSSVPFFDASPMRIDESKISRELAEQMLPPIDAVVRQPFKQLLLSELEYEDLGQVLQFALFHSTPNSKLTGHAHRLKQALENGAVSDNRVREQTAPPMVEVLFVLNGENATAQVNPGDSVGKARDLALAKSDWSRAPQDWEMRDAGGHTVSPLIDARECPPLVYLSLREGLGQVLPAAALTSQQLISILSNHCGESFNGEPGTSEGVVETLTRIIRQRDELRPDPTAARVYIRCDDVALLLAYSVYPIGNPRLEDATKRIRMALARPGPHQIQVDIVDNPSVASKPASAPPVVGEVLVRISVTQHRGVTGKHGNTVELRKMLPLDTDLDALSLKIHGVAKRYCSAEEPPAGSPSWWSGSLPYLHDFSPESNAAFSRVYHDQPKLFHDLSHGNGSYSAIDVRTAFECGWREESSRKTEPAVYWANKAKELWQILDNTALRPGGAYAERDPRDSESRERTALRHALRFLLKLDERVSRFERDAELGAKCNPEDRAWAEQRGSGVVKDD